MKKILLFIALMVPLIAGAANSTIHDLPARSSPNGDERFVVDWLNGPIWQNFYVTLDQIKTFSAGSQGDPVPSGNITQLFVTYNTNNYSYVTNLYSTYNTNLYEYTTNSYNTYNTNLYEYVTNLYATYSTNLYSYITNLYATYITNEYFYTTNISAKVVNITEVLNVNNTIITNNQYFVTNSWSGPTNDIDLSKGDQYYTTLTPCSITGFVNKSNSVSSSVLLTITNAASTNVTLQLPNGVITGDGSKSYTITNATADVISLRYSPVGYTNAVFRAFW